VADDEVADGELINDGDDVSDGDDGVRPPSTRASHSSSRPAPPCSAASADATQSTQHSSSIVALQSRATTVDRRDAYGLAFSTTGLSLHSTALLCTRLQVLAR
jgi:hypothetical protein